MFQASVRNSVAWDDGTMRSDWNFDTIKSTSAMGTFRSMAKDLVMPPGMELDEEDEDNDDEAYGSIDTSGATKGSVPLTAGGLGMNSQAAHSTVIIKPSRSTASEPEQDLPTLLASGDSSSAESASPQTPPQGAPPAYTGSVRSNRRASYAARSAVDGAGTVVREADLGSGVDTIRPVKKVDAMGSLRMSAEFVGSARREGSGSVPSSPTKDSTNRRVASEAAKAGKSIVDDIVLPILSNVRVCLTRTFFG